MKKCERRFSKSRKYFKNIFSFETTNCTSERSFSHLSNLENKFRTSTLQSRLNNLSLMNINSDLLRQINFSDIINAFAEKKSRKVDVLDIENNEED